MKVQLLTMIACACAWVIAPVASAQNLNTDEVNSIIRSLAPSATSTAAAAGTRKPQVEIVIKHTVIVLDPDRSVDAEVFFPFDSAGLTPQTRAALAALGQALESVELGQYQYLVAGHTDAKGRAAYNLDLSARRADSVRRFLVENFAIVPDRLVSAGFGENSLKAPHDPYAGVNRRVEVTLILSLKTVSDE